MGHGQVQNGHCFHKGGTLSPLYLRTSRVSAVTPLKSEVACALSLDYKIFREQMVEKVSSKTMV